MIILRENQQEFKIPPPRLGLKWYPNNCPPISVGVWVTQRLRLVLRFGGLGLGLVLGCFGVGDRVVLLEPKKYFQKNDICFFCKLIEFDKAMTIFSLKLMLSGVIKKDTLKLVSLKSKLRKNCLSHV